MLIKRVPDALGISASGLCALHCLAISVMFAMNPTLRLNRRFYQEWGALLYWSEVVLAVLSLILAAGTLLWGLRRHRRWLPTPFLLAGAVLLGLGIFTRLHAVHPWGLVSVLAGGGLLMFGHGMNIYCSRHPAVSAAASG